MRIQDIFITISIIFVTVVTSAPIPSFEDIEQRWIQGESEKQIHAEHDIRNASPSWPIEREMQSSEFSHALDRRTLETRRNTARDSTGLYGVVRRLFSGAVDDRAFEERSSLEEAPVLKPRKIMRYYFTK